MIGHFFFEQHKSEIVNESVFDRGSRNDNGVPGRIASGIAKRHIGTSLFHCWQNYAMSAVSHMGPTQASTASGLSSEN